MSSDGEALTGLWLEGQRYFPQTLSSTGLVRILPIFGQACLWLERYFHGENPGECPTLHLSGTPFQLSVWEMLRLIPYGETATYGEIAKQIAAKSGRQYVSARAVGGAVARNPISLMIPCHRVIGAGGDLTGYAGGLDRKRKLLMLERRSHSREINVDFVQISDSGSFPA